jgi:hypothetical protein
MKVKIMKLYIALLTGLSISIVHSRSVSILHARIPNTPEGKSMALSEEAFKALELDQRQLEYWKTSETSSSIDQDRLENIYDAAIYKNDVTKLTLQLFFKPKVRMDMKRQLRALKKGEKIIFEHEDVDPSVATSKEIVFFDCNYYIPLGSNWSLGGKGLDGLMLTNIPYRKKLVDVLDAEIKMKMKSANYEKVFKELADKACSKLTHNLINKKVNHMIDVLYADYDDPVTLSTAKSKKIKEVSKMRKSVKNLLLLQLLKNSINEKTLVAVESTARAIYILNPSSSKNVGELYVITLSPDLYDVFGDVRCVMLPADFDEEDQILTSDDLGDIYGP